MRILVAGTGLTALVLGAGIVISVLVAGASLTALVLGIGVVIAGVSAGLTIVIGTAGLAVAIVFAGAGCLAVGAVDAGSFTVGAWLVIAVTVTGCWLDLGMVAVVALGRNSGQ